MHTRTPIVLVTVLATVVGLAAAVLLFAYSGAYDVTATSGHTGVVRWLLHTTRERSIRVRADDAPEPPLTDSSAVAHGFEHFDAMCVQCHGAPGVERGEVGKGMTPTPPELAEGVAEMTPRELFWVTKHGIKLAGMPAFGPTHSDEEIWGIVAFLERLPEMNPERYERWRERAGTTGDGSNGGDGHGHAPGTPPHGH